MGWLGEVGQMRSPSLGCMPRTFPPVAAALVVCFIIESVECVWDRIWGCGTGCGVCVVNQGSEKALEEVAR